MMDDMRFTYGALTICVNPNPAPCGTCNKKRVTYSVDPWYVLAFRWVCIDHIKEQLRTLDAPFNRRGFLNLADETIERGPP